MSEQWQQLCIEKSTTHSCLSGDSLLPVLRGRRPYAIIAISCFVLIEIERTGWLTVRVLEPIMDPCPGSQACQLPLVLQILAVLDKGVGKRTYPCFSNHL